MQQASCSPVSSSTTLTLAGITPPSTITFLNGLNVSTSNGSSTSSSTSSLVNDLLLESNGFHGIQDNGILVNHISHNNNDNQRQHQQNNLVNNNNNSISNALASAVVSSSTTTSFNNIINSVNTSNNNSSSSLDIYTCQVNNGPRAILTCCANSHPFEERTLDVSNPVKIGRAVARCKASPTNGIFDCKVLSRNHALFWFEDGKFYLQDTKSSNGTFINKQRLSSTNTESCPTEVCSGDVVQFGVDVVENTKRVTHGCVVASIRLYLPGGEEATRSSNIGNEDLFSSTAASPGGPNSNAVSNTNNNPLLPSTISPQQLMQLTQCLKEALNREEFLEKKMVVMENVISTLTSKSKEGWTGLVEEDRLLSRIESLQCKLETLVNCLNSKSAEDEVTFLRNQVVKLHDERDAYESAAKESIYQAKMRESEAASLASELQVQLKSSQTEVERLMASIEEWESQVSKMSESMEKKNQEFEEVTKKHASYEETIKSLEETIESLKKSIADANVVPTVLNNHNHVGGEEDEQIEEKKLSEKVKKEPEDSEEKTEGIASDSFSSLIKSSPSSLDVADPDTEKNDSVKKTESDANGPDSDQSDDLSTQQENQRLKVKLREMGSLLKLREDLVSDLTSKLESHQKKALFMEKDFESKRQDIEHQLNQAQESISSLETVIQSLQKEKASALIVTEKSPLKEDERNGNRTSKLEEQLQTTQILLQASQAEVSSLRDQVHQRSQSVSLLKDEVSKLRETTSVLESKLQPHQLNLGQGEKLNRSAIITTEVPPTTHNEPTLSLLDDLQELQSLLLSKEQDIISKQEELDSLKTELSQVSQCKNQLEDSVSSLKDDLEIVKYQNKIASTCAIVPLLLLVLAFFMAFYPAVSTVTGTLDS